MNVDARGRERLLGTLGSADGKGVVRMEDRFDADLAAYLSGRDRRDAAARFGELFPAYQALEADSAM